MMRLIEKQLSERERLSLESEMWEYDDGKGQILRYTTWDIVSRLFPDRANVVTVLEPSQLEELKAAVKDSVSVAPV